MIAVGNCCGYSCRPRSTAVVRVPPWGRYKVRMRWRVAGSGKTIGKRQVEQLVQRAAIDFDAYYARQRPATDAPSGAILAITVDGKGVVMRPEDLREPTRKAHQHQAGHLDAPLHQGERNHAKRMATVAAF